MSEKKKEKRSKLSEAEKRERVAAALAKKKDLESRAIQIVHREAKNASLNTCEELYKIRYKILRLIN